VEIFKTKLKHRVVKVLSYVDYFSVFLEENRILYSTKSAETKKEL